MKRCCPFAPSGPQPHPAAKLFVSQKDYEERLVWQMGNAIFGLYHLVGVGRATVEACRSQYGIGKRFA
ncbi:MAG: hypothetical protein ABI167_00430 [Nitrosospira sp.]